VTYSDKTILEVVRMAGDIARSAYIRHFSYIYHFDTTFRLTSEGRLFYKNVAKVHKWVEKVILTRKNEYKRKYEPRTTEPLSLFYVGS